MLGSDFESIGWPACGEIDIMELIGDEPNLVHGSLHGINFGLTGDYEDNNGFSNGFHNYSVNWQPGVINFYVDGNNYET